MTAGALPGESTGPGSLDAAVLRIFTASGSSVGLGFLVTDRFALTCAHVVAAALEIEYDVPPPVGAELLVDLPLLGPARAGAGVKASVEQWFPEQPSGEGDVAVLRLEALPADARPVRLVEADDVWDHPARAYGLPAGRPAGVWHSGVLRHRQANGLVQADLTGGGYRVSPGFSGSPVWDDELAGVVGMMAAAEPGQPPVSYLIPTSGLLATWPGLRELVLPPTPFRGLRPFLETDAAIFHGRRDESDHVARIVAGERWTTLVGPSGSGKSSLAMAGVIPRRREAGDCPVVMRPGHHATPSHALASALLPLLEPELSETRRLSEVSALTAELALHGLHEIAPRILELHGADRLLVVVDQLEELLDLQPAAVDELAGVLFADDLPATVKVLCTLRADFLEPVLAHPRLRLVVRERLCPLAPMSSEQLSEIITRPVDEIPGVRYQPGLVDRVLADAGTEPGALPLLGFTLDLLWARQDRGELTHHAYEELGGVAGALGAYAERVWTENVPSADGASAERLLTRLVGVPIGATAATRRVVPRAELGEQEWRIAQKLAATRLLVLKGGDGSESVELAHEALLTGWDRLARQVVADRSFLDWRESLRYDLGRWRSGGQVPDLLPTASSLAVARQWLPKHAADLSEAERDYLERGRVHRRRQTRRRRTLFSGLVIVVVAVLVLASLFAYARQESDERQATADSRALAQASQDVSNYDPALSVMTAMTAYQTAPTQEARNQLFRQYLAYSHATRVLSGLPGKIVGFDTSQDGDVVLASTELGSATLFVHAATGRLRSVPINTGYMRYPLVSRDGKRAGFVNEDGTAGWFDVSADASRLTGRVHRLPKVANPEYDYDGLDDLAAMSNDGKLIAVPTADQLVWWDLDAGTVAGSLPRPEGLIEGLWVSQDNKTLLMRTSVLTPSEGVVIGLVAVDMATGLTRNVLPPRPSQYVLVSGDRTAAVVSQNQPNGTYLVSLVRVSDGVTMGRPYTTAKSFLGESAAVDATGRWVVMEEGTPTLVDLHRGIKVAAAKGGSSTFGHHAGDLVSVGGKFVLATMEDTRITHTELLPVSSTAVDVIDLKLRPDGREMISTLKDGTVQRRLVATDDYKVLAEVPGPQSPWTSIRNDLVIDWSARLAAVQTAANVVTVRDITTLRQTVRITAAMPPDYADEQDDRFKYFFDGKGNLLTVSGTVVQQWDLRTGRQLARFDAGSLHPRDDIDPDLLPTVWNHPAANQVSVIVPDDPVIRVVDLRTGHTTTTMKAVPDVRAIAFDRSGRYFVLLRQSAVVELWRRDPLRREIGPLYSLTGLIDTPIAVGFLDGDGRYAIAANNAVRIYQIGQKAPTEFYDFGNPDGSHEENPYSFIDVSKDGRTVLYTMAVDRIPRLLVLDPTVWERHLCQVIGYRDFAADERDSLSAPVRELCPATG